jgi:hypothetical protein
VERVQLARHPKRPFTLDYIDRAFTDFIELHGDRAFRDDEAIVCGWARLDGRSVMVIGHQKGRDMKENLRRNFGMPHPEGYRKALRLMQQAEKFGAPIVTLIDTPGAYPGLGAEERGQAEAIARNLRRWRGCACRSWPCHRRRRQRRRAGAGRGRPHPDARELDLQRHLAGGLRGDPVEDGGREGQGGGSAEADGRTCRR